MRIVHLALRSDWERARREGRYTTSTRGRTLAEEGFVHACRGDQWQAVRERWYADVDEPLVLLVLDPDRLGVPVVDEPDPVTGEIFPHVYGAIDPAAVVQAVALDAPAPAPAPTSPSPAPAGGGREDGVGTVPSFSRVFLAELFHHVRLAAVVMVAVVAGALVGVAAGGWGPAWGVLAGLVVGVPVAVALNRRRERQLAGPGA